MFKLFVVGLLLGLSACSHVPKGIRKAPTPNVQMADAVRNFTANRGHQVRWGGFIIDMENLANQSIIQIMAYPLNRYGKPNLKHEALGRFMVKTEKFLDPAIYSNSKDTQVTILGLLIDETTLMVGQKKLKLPVVELQQIYLWPKYQPREYPLYYDPYPFGSYRYFGYPYRCYYFPDY